MKRREFLRAAALTGGTLVWSDWAAGARAAQAVAAAQASAASVLPPGPTPPPLAFPHFPGRLHAFVWRNWPLVPIERMAQVLGATVPEIAALGERMGLGRPPRISPDQQRRSHITIIRRNWHLLNYGQLLELLGWTAEELAFVLREDDFLYIKLGRLKPSCDPLRYAPSSPEILARETQIAATLREELGATLGREGADPLFGFVARLTEKPRLDSPAPVVRRFAPRYCYSYFALYGDPLLDRECSAYPEGYLARLAAAGVDGVWLQGVLSKLAPFPWDPALSARHDERLETLRQLVARARQQGIGVYLYLNEPRSMPLAFFEAHPHLKGVVEGDSGTLCTSQTEVQDWLRGAVASVCQAAPDLAGLFTITASENLTNCWSHHQGSKCPRCGPRPPADVIAEVNTLVQRGIEQSGSQARLIAWDWGWADAWAQSIIEQLPRRATLMSVSEWSLPLRRGGVETTVGEYSISAIGPGPRAQRHWQWARRRGLRTLAKIQAGVTWELSAVPYLPALENVARHAVNLLSAQVDGLMLGWTLGGYPSPNLEIVREAAALADGQPEPLPAAPDSSAWVERAMRQVAQRRFGPVLAEPMVAAWRAFSRAFGEFPFDGSVVYNAPMQCGPSNLLFAQPTGYRSTMVGFPYDDLNQWRGPYPADVFIGQMEKVAQGFEEACHTLRQRVGAAGSGVSRPQLQQANEELDVAEAAAIHFRSTANQARFVRARQIMAEATAGEERAASRAELIRLLREELVLARRLYALQRRDSRIGFEASNQYYYVPEDLAEKVLNCRWLLEQSSS